MRKEDVVDEGGRTMVGVRRGLDEVGLFEDQIKDLRYGIARH